MSLILFVIIATLAATIYAYVANACSYWKRKGIPFIKPKFPFGTFTNTFLQKTSFSDAIRELYNTLDEPIVGIYFAVNPGLLIRDPKTIQDILVTDFSSFRDRTRYVDEKIDPMADNLLLQRGDKWKYTRTKLSPTFTSGKLKGMFDTIVDCVKSLQIHLDGIAKSGDSVNTRELFAQFATNVLASVAFGIDVDCIENPDAEFRKYGRKIFDSTIRNALRGISQLSPTLSKFFGVRFTDKDVAQFMVDTVRQNSEYREKNNIVRKDFFQLLIQLRNTGYVEESDDWSTKASQSETGTKETFEEMAAQAFVFFVAGFESSSSTLSFCMYEFARNPETQQKAYDEITSVLKDYDGTLNYESAMEMKYTENCIDETLRMHPPISSFTRRCTKNYKLQNSGLVIEKGTPIVIPSIGLHYDSKYFYEPEKFIPDRFSEENTIGKSFIEMPFLAFGTGPRSCIGLRLAKLQIKITIILLLRRFKFELGEEHKGNELELDPRSQMAAPLNGINMKVSFRPAAK